jgi:hypothetical protein
VERHFSSDSLKKDHSLTICKHGEAPIMVLSVERPTKVVVDCDDSPRLSHSSLQCGERVWRSIMETRSSRSGDHEGNKMRELKVVADVSSTSSTHSACEGFSWHNLGRGLVSAQGLATVSGGAMAITAVVGLLVTSAGLVLPLAAELGLAAAGAAAGLAVVSRGV